MILEPYLASLSFSSTYLILQEIKDGFTYSVLQVPNGSLSPNSIKVNSPALKIIHTLGLLKSYFSLPDLVL